MTEDGAAAIREKIADPDLLELTRTGRHESVSVIVELNVPRAHVELRRDEMGTAWRAGQVAVSDPRMAELRDEIGSQAEALLRRLSGEEPVWLPGRSSIGVRLDSDQLEEVALSPLVRRVHLSKLRR